MSRGSTWASDEVSLLISIWADEKIQQQLDSCSRKRQIFEKIAKRLEAEGAFMRSYQQINEKIKQLKKCYKKIKDNNSLSGRSRKTFKHFDEMDEVMGDRPITRPSNLFESSEQASIESSSDNEDEIQISKEPDFDDDVSLIGQEDLIESSLSSTSPTPSPAATASSGSATPPLPMPTTVPNKSIQTPVNKEKILSSRRGKSKKRSRNEVFMSTAFEIMQKQQQAADDKFFLNGRREATSRV